MTEDIEKAEQELREQQQAGKAVVEDEDEQPDLSALTIIEGLKCPMCLKRPTSGIYCCQKCHNMVCGRCKDDLRQCPQCRDDFTRRPPQRNVLMERTFKLN